MHSPATLVILAALVADVSGQSPATVCAAQAYDSQGLSPLAGDTVTVRGCVTLPPGYLDPDNTSFYIGQAECGVNVFRSGLPGVTLALGDSVRVEGEVEEHFADSGAGAETRILVFIPEDLLVLLSGLPEPAPVDTSCLGVQQEGNEGRLLRTWGVVLDTDFNDTMYLGDATGFLRVYRSDNAAVSFAGYVVGDTLRITGIVRQYDRTAPYLDGYELAPRFQWDIEWWHASAASPGSWGRIKAQYRSPSRPPN